MPLPFYYFFSLRFRQLPIIPNFYLGSLKIHIPVVLTMQLYLELLYEGANDLFL